MERMPDDRAGRTRRKRQGRNHQRHHGCLTHRGQSTTAEAVWLRVVVEESDQPEAAACTDLADVSGSAVAGLPSAEASPAEWRAIQQDWVSAPTHSAPS